MTQTILAASGQRKIDEAIGMFEGYEVVHSVEYKRDLEEACEYFQPDILVVGEGLSGQESLIELLLGLTKKFPMTRVVYLAGYVDMRNEVKVHSLGLLVMAGINDIVHERKITLDGLKNLLDNPKTPEQMRYLTRKVREETSKNKHNLIEFEIPEEKEEVQDDVYKNLFVVSSIKPGTGKSFISTNLAAAIAVYGVEKNGRKPRVALIEADLQNLSVGTLLQIEDDKRHLKAVVDKISTIVNDQGNLTGDLKETEQVNDFILDCFKPYYRAKNLEALVGSQLKFNQIESVKPYHYVYLIDAIVDHYDVIIIDTNSSLTHVTTYPLLHMANTCYYVINLDFNNVRNNVRYKSILKEMGILDKVKYILNEDIDPDGDNRGHEGLDLEELVFTADHLDDSDFKLEGRIPALPKTVFLNRLYDGLPVVLDNKKYTLKARYEILKVANQIWTIKNFKDIEKQLEREQARNRKKKGILFK